jgi:hypothetical protein
MKELSRAPRVVRPFLSLAGFSDPARHLPAQSCRRSWQEEFVGRIPSNTHT